MTELPQIIQGGMGMGVSNWVLAGEVARQGQLGVVSGTAIDSIFVRRLQDGDPGGHVRRALRSFPSQDLAQRLLAEYFVAGGIDSQTPYKRIPMFSLRPPQAAFDLSVAANFVEVFLAKSGHNGLVGINLLHKILLPNLSSLYGAMLAGVDVVLMGAGIPRDIPAILDRLALHQPVKMKIPVEGAAADAEHWIHFDPATVIPNGGPPLRRPHFLAIISSATLAIALARKAEGRVDGFVVEGAPAGGHNAPPRGPLQLNARGEPIYGQRDEADLVKIRGLGLPFWLAGAYADPEKLQDALDQGAAGIQVGTAFAFCRESGMAEWIKQAVITAALKGNIDIVTDPVASPTGFPFKVVQLLGTVSQPDEYAQRPRLCDLGYLRTLYQRSDGSIGYRCASEAPDVYVKKGGRLEETAGRKCLCNGLLAAIGLAQVQDGGYIEPPIVTSGEDLKRICRFLQGGKTSYAARDVIRHILARRHPTPYAVFAHRDAPSSPAEPS